MRIMLDNLIGDSLGRQLCSCDNDQVPPLEIAAVDLTFIPRNSSFWLCRLPRTLSEKVLGFLTHRISNNPNDLTAHVQRVAAHYQAGTSESLYGALLDLFIVLDTKGYELRKRMLSKCTPVLSSGQQEVLVAGLESGIKPDDRVPLTPASLLKLPNSGSVYLVERLDGHVAVVNFDALDEARDLIDSGFIEEARMLLEELITNQPECEETNKELLDLYRYTKNRKAFFATRQRLEEVPLALSEVWDELANKFMSMEERVGNE